MLPSLLEMRRPRLLGNNTDRREPNLGDRADAGMPSQVQTVPGKKLAETDMKDKCHDLHTLQSTMLAMCIPLSYPMAPLSPPQT